MPSNSLEQEAMDRVARMYSSFDRRSHSRPPQRPTEPDRKPEPIEEKQENKAPAVSLPRETQKKNSGFLDLLMKDKDQSLIMLLLVILMKDGADMNLLLALIYLLI